MKADRKLNGLLVYQAVVYAVGVMLATGLVADWGAWYSSSTPYRTQTEALLRGDLAVSRNVGDLKFDHTWSEQGVQQVWGLGVPLWRLPFEAAAKMLGFDAFPDRLAFGLFALLVGLVVLKVWMSAEDGTSNPCSTNAPAPSAGWQLITGFGAGVIILLLFPPFLTLLQVRGAVWEEAVAYEYLFAVLQVTLLVAFVRQPVAWRFLIVCALAGFGGLIRPTLAFYGFATVVVASVAWLVTLPRQASRVSPVTRSGGGEEGQTPSVSPLLIPADDRNELVESKANSSGKDIRECWPTLRRKLWPALLGLLLFGLGGGALWFTNLKRFGNGFEFGHRLNVQYLYGSMHATRFDDPFQDEPLGRAAQELFGALFLAENFNGADFYQENIFPGQSPTVRWREFYFRTYDWSYLPLLLLGWGAAVAAALAAARWHLRTGGWVFSPWKSAIRQRRLIPLGNRPPAPATDHLPLISLGLWSLLASLPLAAFFLYAPVIASRYLTDLAPSFAAALAAAWLFIAGHCHLRWNRVLACLLLCGWLGTELYLSRSAYAGPVSVTWAKLKVLREQPPASDGGTNTYRANDYGQNLTGEQSKIPFDRVGWNAETGAVMPLVILFVKTPDYLELDFETQAHPRIVANPENIRAKVGLEFLERTKITKLENGWRVRFRGPQQPRWRDGLQAAFVATVPKEFLAEKTTPWILKAVRWRDQPGHANTALPLDLR